MVNHLDACHPHHTIFIRWIIAIHAQLNLKCVYTNDFVNCIRMNSQHLLETSCIADNVPRR